MGNVLFLIIGLSAGTIVAGGVFTTLIALGLVPRFAGRTHTARAILWYENSIILGAVWATLFTLWNFAVPVLQAITDVSKGIMQFALGVSGVGFGCFVGCMALAIAEFLDGIPILARRLSFRRGLGVAIFSVAIGKMIGSLLYWYWRMG